MNYLREIDKLKNKFNGKVDIGYTNLLDYNFKGDIR